MTAAAEFTAYMRDLAEERRRVARARTWSATSCAAEDGGERLTDDELVASAILLLNAGHEASVNAFGNGMVALLGHPDQLARLRADRGAGRHRDRGDDPLRRAAAAVRAHREGGRRARRRDGAAREARVAALLGSANRDPAAFDDGRHASTSAAGPTRTSASAPGVHHCLGAPLARMELQISLPTLLRRCPGLHLAGEPVRRPTFVLRGYASVPVSAD